MAAIILVHGGWHGAWCWYKVAPLLARYGHRVRTPDLPGHGLDPLPPGQATLAGYAAALGAGIAAAGEPVLLVGHSFGGIVISQAAEDAAPGAVRRLAYLAAFLPASGQSLVSLAAGDHTGELTAASARTPDGLAVSLHPDRARELLYGDCPAEDATVALSLLRPEPIAPLATPVTTTAERFGRIPRACLVTARDRGVPPELQRAMLAAVPCADVFTLDTGHSPFLAAPEVLAAALDELARR